MATRMFLNGGVYSMADSGRLDARVEGLTIDTVDGRVLAVGPQCGPVAASDVLQLPAGAVIVPGLHDRHTHWLFALFANAVVLGGVKTLAEAAARGQAPPAEEATGRGGAA